MIKAIVLWVTILLYLTDSSVNAIAIVYINKNEPVWQKKIKIIHVAWCQLFILWYTNGWCFNHQMMIKWLWCYFAWILSEVHFLTLQFWQEESITLKYTYVIIWVTIYISVLKIEKKRCQGKQMAKFGTKVHIISKLFKQLKK